MFPGKSITLKAGAHIGHGAIIHGANIGRNCLIGMNAVIMDDAKSETNASLAHWRLSKPKRTFPPEGWL
jgi:phenylacetic acid degradation protein